MTLDLKPGQLAAHKTQPDKPWVVTVPPDERDGLVQDVCVAYVAADGRRVMEFVLACELEPYAFAFDDRFHALIAAAESHGDEAVRERVTVLLRQAWNLYVDLTGGEGATDE